MEMLLEVCDYVVNRDRPPTLTKREANRRLNEFWRMIRAKWRAENERKAGNGRVRKDSR